MLTNYIICLEMQLDSESNWSSSFATAGQFFLIIIAFAIVLFLAYFSTRWIGSMKMGARRNSSLKIVSTMPLGGSNSLQVVKVGERYFLIGVSKENITFISEVSKDDISEIEVEKVKLPFEKYFQDCFSKFKNVGTNDGADKNDKTDEK